jgi:hypothetical protein
MIPEQKSTLVYAQYDQVLVDLHVSFRVYVLQRFSQYRCVCGQRQWMMAKRPPKQISGRISRWFLTLSR